jgi:hypothetical protein
MKTILLIIAVAISMPVMAETYTGKKCKLKWDKTKQEAEIECYDITKSEHFLTITPAKPVVEPAKTDSRWSLTPK